MLCINDYMLPVSFSHGGRDISSVYSNFKTKTYPNMTHAII